ncbi:hypothetical protein MGG_17467 [Pyricularia oryzae 70-15]|uniref:Uncharacterized protein n=1 Tax=Pyricularia oryzae (strain 70-15 / ATCC MYA-4617 / FGSC 8958) TaxID=242507 RepID=G4NCM9_PYRO7|nr:uncharacterized protein MGG_17467 [Pyricularia oryzae 70-15]EHA49123.1 hypothetical protein MGG_17467 [Pyricularia oryzae 70-15]
MYYEHPASMPESWLDMRTGNTPDEDATESIIFSRVSTKRLIVKPVTYFDGKHLRTAISGEG